MRSSVKHFLRPYDEMVLGMAVLGLPADWALRSVGADSDAFMFLGMATTQVTA